MAEKVSGELDRKESDLIVEDLAYSLAVVQGKAEVLEVMLQVLGALDRLILKEGQQQWGQRAIGL